MNPFQREHANNKEETLSKTENTVIVVATLMLSCVFALIVEGKMPVHVTNNELFVFSVLLSFSSLLLACCLWNGFIVFRRINR
jgi:uncharacterized protein YqhQ